MEALYLGEKRVSMSPFDNRNRAKTRIFLPMDLKEGPHEDSRPREAGS
jgi:hypothetical protein